MKDDDVGRICDVHGREEIFTHWALVGMYLDHVTANVRIILKGA